MISTPPFRKTLLSLLVSGATIAMAMPEAVRAAQCEATTDSEGNVTTASGICDRYNKNTPIGGDFTNLSTIEIPDNKDKGIRIKNTYVDNLFNKGTITGQGEGDWGMYFSGLQFISIDNQATISAVEKGIEVSQKSTNAGSIINRANINSYGDAIRVTLKNNSTLDDISNTGVLTTLGTVPDIVDISQARGIGVEVKDNSSLGNINNDGVINSVDAGIRIDTHDNSDSGNIVNSGVIRSNGNTGIYVYTRDNSDSGDVSNSGVIEDSDTGVYMHVEDYSSVGNFLNSGIINSIYKGVSIQGYNNVQIGNITNTASGTIQATSENLP